MKTTHHSSVVSRKRHKQSWRDGNIAATRYKRACPDARKSNEYEDINLHVDFWHGDKGVDVKGNNLPDEIWVEFKNVRGKDGGLYGGARILAFDMPEEGGFSIVDRQQLAFFCEKHVRNEKVTDKRNAYLKRYTRKDREDVISKLK